MPKPLLRPTGANTQNQGRLDLSQNLTQKQNQQTQQIDKMKLDRLLRKPRSKEYMEALHRLDAGGHVRNQNLDQKSVV